MNDERHPYAGVIVLAQVMAAVLGVLAGVAVYNAVT